jgi:type I restriction enzyme S subunit
MTRGIGNDGKIRPRPSKAPHLYKQSELGLIPKEWDVKPLGDSDVAIINPPSDALCDSFVYIDLENVKEGKLLKENYIQRIGAPSRAQRTVKDYDILFQLVRPYQKNNLLFLHSTNRQYVASTGYAVIRTIANARYVYQLLHTEVFVNKVLSLCTGTGYPAITPLKLGGILIPVPDHDEQSLIADRLAAVDARIESEENAIAKYRKIKAGLMHRLLTPPSGAEIVDLAEGAT